MARVAGIVQAAGGVVWRAAAAGDGVDVLLVHRPRYDDWSLPKGKLDPAESHEQAALREVEEETGLRVQLGDELAESFYIDSRGRPKRVRYWAMTVDGGRFAPTDEVDQILWLPANAARERLSYDRDAAVLDSFLEVIRAR